MRRILAALQFLTIVPVPGQYHPAEGAGAFPLIGAALGTAAGGIFLSTAQIFGANIAALLALAFLLAIAGGLHEDGLADVFDALRAGRSRERMLAILKDSRIGAHGALALVIAVLLRWQGIAASGTRAVAVLASALAASRGAMVALAYVSPALGDGLGDGLGKAFCAGLRPSAVAIAVLLGAAFPFTCGVASGVVAVSANAATLWVVRAWFQHRLGGVTGDCLGAACQISEIVTLLVLICPRFI
jgi:adenosylcobinamide-GDP ribazoletransferase